MRMGSRWDHEAGDDVAPVAKPRSAGGRRSLGKVLGVLAGIAAIAAIAIGVYWLFLSSMTVDLHLKRQSVASTLAYQVTQPGADASAASSDGIVIPGQPVEFTLSRSATVPATGQTIIPDEAASGEVVLRNPTDAIVTIEKGTQFAGFSGVSYSLGDSGGSGVGQWRAGRGHCPHRSASEGGEAGNAATGMLTGQLPNGVYYSNRLSEIAGGTQKTEAVTISQTGSRISRNRDRQ
ncbi:MAG: hypothetical protein R2848_15470 [Thermomicrobiales bacterium]